MAENIAFSDWSEKLDTAGTNHWLPAYGLQQPSIAMVGNKHQQNDSAFDSGARDHANYFDDDDDDDNEDDLCDSGDDDNWSSFNQNSYSGNIVRSTSYIFLETILEETSDDLRSDSEKSSEEDFIKEENWSVKNRDPFKLFNSGNNKTAVRVKYDNNDPGVHDDDDDNDPVFFGDNLHDRHLWSTDGVGSDVGGGAGGSLLQFESLEKQCAEQTVFRTTATAAPFMTNSAESLNRPTSGIAARGRHGWKHQQQTVVDDDGNVATAMDDDEAMLCSTPFSSFAGDGSSVKSLSKSMESVHSAASRSKRCIRDDVSQSLEDLRRCGGRDDCGHYDSSTAEPATGGGMYKTVDCLIDPAYRESSDETDGGKPSTQEDTTVATAGCKQQQQRSAENLSEDSGFGDQVPAAGRCGSAAVQTYKPIVEDENYFEMSTKSIASIAAAKVSATVHAAEKGTDDDDDDDDEMKSKFSPAWHSYTDLGVRQPSVTPTTSPTTDGDDDDADDDDRHHRHHQLPDGMASRLPMSSTPNLCADGLMQLADSGGDYMRAKKLLLDSTVSLDRSHSLKRIHYESESALSAASSRGSNLLITTSFVSLAAAPTPNKGVHFCPVVSEVNWRESFSSSSCVDDDYENASQEPPETEDDDDDDDDDDDRRNGVEVDENIDTMVMKLLTGLPSENRRPSVAEKQQLRERLDFITGGSPPVSQRIGAAPTRATATGFAAQPLPQPVSVQSRSDQVDTSSPVAMSKSKSIGGKLGGFFQRFSLRRLSGRRNKEKKKQKPEGADDVVTVQKVASTTAGNNCSRPDTPPPPPPVSGRQSAVMAGGGSSSDNRGKKPPLPPQPPSDSGYTTRRRLVYDENRSGRVPPTAGSRASLQSRSPAAAMSRPDHRAGLLETDLDSNVTRTSSSSLMMGGGGCSPNKKARSLLDLGASSAKLSLAPSDSNRPPVDGSSSNASDYRAKSMEFLLDKENQAAVQTDIVELQNNLLCRTPLVTRAPENELRKINVNGGERILSEHELRVQRSLQRLNLPEWYKTCNVPAQGFLLKRHSDAGYTTSMSSLSSNQSQSPKMYSNYNNTLLSPQTHAATKNFSRWSTSRLNGSNSNSTSPCSSTRSSFNYRQPYLGWRSQEKLSKPRTPAERLAAGLLAQQQPEQMCQTSLSEVQSSIKEVTSAIANYVSSSTPDGSKERLNNDFQDTPSRCPSFRGSTGRLCWLESSFVGNKRPSLTRETPSSEISTPPPHRKATPIRQTQNNSSWVNVSGNDAVAATLQKKPNNNNDCCVLAVAAGTVRCRYSECRRSATVSEARRTFKTCHNCNHVYCSRRCRRAHWQAHRKTCLDRRTATLCQSVVDAVKGDRRCAERLSTIARRGYLTHGRGAVRCYFSGVELANRFARDPGGAPCEPTYVKWTDVESELDMVQRLCKEYDPDRRFVLHVSVCVQSEVPGPGPVQWERHVVYKCVKLRLDKSLRADTTANEGSGNGSGGSDDDRSATASSSAGRAPETLILTSLPGAERLDTRKCRQVCFVNVQRHLRQRGVELRHQFPDVHRKLCEYVDGPADCTFTPVTVYPRDRASGKTFMCIIMPGAEPEKLRLLPEDSDKVRTIDVGRERDNDNTDERPSLVSSPSHTSSPPRCTKPGNSP